MHLFSENFGVILLLKSPFFVLFKKKSMDSIDHKAKSYVTDVFHRSSFMWNPILFDPIKSQAHSLKLSSQISNPDFMNLAKCHVSLQLKEVSVLVFFSRTLQQIN